MLIAAVVLSVLHIIISFVFNKNLTLFTLGYVWHRPQSITSIILLIFIAIISYLMYQLQFTVYSIIVWALILQFIPAWNGINSAYNKARSESAKMALDPALQGMRDYHVRRATSTNEELKQEVIKYYKLNKYN